jgi:hypothetical protein
MVTKRIRASKKSLRVSQWVVHLLAIMANGLYAVFYIFEADLWAY